MPSSSTAAVRRPEAFAPCIIPLDPSNGGLSCFASETDREAPPVSPVAPAPAPIPDARAALTPRGTRSASRLVIRVPATLGAGTVAMLVGVFCGLVIAAIASPLERRALGVGRLLVTSEPSGMIVTVDGTSRGVTPMAAVVDVGPHHVIVGSGAGARPRLLRVTPGGESSVHVEQPHAHESAAEVARVTAVEAHASSGSAPAVVAPQATEGDPTVAQPERQARRAAGTPTPVRRSPTGWITVSSPFPVRVLRDGVDVGGSDDGNLVVPAGEQVITLANDDLEFRDERTVTVAANRVRPLTLEAPLGVLHANARPWAEVWVDGRRAGDTPLGNVSLPVGEHEIVFRHPELGEARQLVMVGARTPARVAVELQP